MGRGNFFIINIVILILLSLSSFALNISSTTYDIDLYKDSEKTFYTMIQNTENNTVYDIYIQDINYLTFPVIEQMSYNETIRYNFTAFTNQTVDATLQSKLIWFYQEYVESATDTYYVNITDSGFVPNNIKLDENDILVFENKDSVTHTISEFDDLFSLTLTEGQEDQLVFSDAPEDEDIINNYTIIDENTGYILNLEVINKTQLTKVHYSEDDIPLTFDVVAQYPSSGLEIEMFTNDFVIDHNGYADGVMQIKAVDDSYDIRLDMKWATFSTNNFPLAKDQTKIITYRIEPDISKTSDTNKTYNFNLNISSDNTPFYQELVKINVPYAFLGTEDEKDKVKIIQIFDEDACYDYCEKYPDRCPLKTETKIEYILKKQNITLSEKQLTEMLEENTRLRNKVEGQSGEISSLKNYLTNFQQNLTGDLTYLKQEQEQENEKEQDRNVSFGIILISFFIIITLSILVYILPRYFKRIKNNKLREQGVF